MTLSCKMIPRSVVAATSSFHSRSLCSCTKFSIPASRIRVVATLSNFSDISKRGGLPTTLHVSKLMAFSTERYKSTLPFTKPEEYPRTGLDNTVKPIPKVIEGVEEADKRLRDENEDENKPMRLTPDVPPRARTVQVRGTNRRSVITQYLRACSVDVNYDYRSWAEHNGPWRNIEVWSPRELWRNSDLRRIFFPDVAFTGLVAAGITYYNQLCASAVWLLLDTDGDGDVSVTELKAGIDAGLVEAHHIMGTDFFITSDMITLGTTIPFTLTSIALGMMLTFRTQNCNARYNEGRQVWGGMVNEGRALSSRIMAIVGRYPKDSEVAKAGTHAVKLIMTFSRALKYHVTTDGHCPDLSIRLSMTDSEVSELKAEALRQELATVWDFDDPIERAYVDRLLSSDVANRPLHVLQEISEINAQVLMKSKEDGGAGLAPHHSDAIFRSITRFQDVLGACERLYKTPIYTGATRFTSRCVFLWTNLIPLALYPIMGPVATIPGSVVVAMFMYGLEDVGARIEQPFAALPLWQYCDGIDAGCKQTLAQHQLLKQVPRI